MPRLGMDGISNTVHPWVPVSREISHLWPGSDRAPTGLVRLRDQGPEGGGPSPRWRARFCSRTPEPLPLLSSDSSSLWRRCQRPRSGRRHSSRRYGPGASAVGKGTRHRQRLPCARARIPQKGNVDGARAARRCLVGLADAPARSSLDR
jgi:hypothetical protein